MKGRSSAGHSGGKTDPKTHSPSAHPDVSARWLMVAASISVAAAAVCGWLTLCLLFWQGSWQLLYHPTSAVTRTPASVGVAFEPIAFAATEAGEPRLKGWWIPAATSMPSSRYTVLYLHGRTGNLSDAVESLAALHSAGVNILAFDYRGYGQSQFIHPSEAHWQEDAEWALQYLTATRHVSSGSIVLDGRELGANLTLEAGADHPELAGVVIESPLASPVDAILNDPRARVVPARLLVRDRFDEAQAAGALRIPSLWLAEEQMPAKVGGEAGAPVGYDRVMAEKSLVLLKAQSDSNRARDEADQTIRWLDGLTARNPAPVP